MTQTLNNLPDMEIWLVGDQAYLVTYVPDTDPPIPMAWTISPDELTAALGPGQDPNYDATMSEADFAAVGAIIHGDRSELANPSIDPYLAWENTVQAQAAVRPWLQDEEVLLLIAEGLFEGREISLAEFQQTRWWSERTEGERAWAELVLSDPLTAEQQRESDELIVRNLLEQSGVLNPPDEIVSALANRFTTGVWLQAQLEDQIRALADPASSAMLDPEIQTIIDTGIEVDTTRQGEDTVRDLVLRWLGPVHGQWSEGNVAEWAGRIRNDPDAMQDLEDHLSKQRLALFPEYENQALSYEDIAAPWRGYVTQVWGQTADETDPMFVDIVRRNDIAEAGRILRSEGLKQNIGKVKTDYAAGMMEALGGQVRRPI